MPEKIKYILITAVMLFIGFISSLLPGSMRMSLGSAIGTLMRLLSRKRREITLNNIRNAFPDKDQAWHNNIMAGSYRNLGITLVELLSMKNMKESDVRQYIKYTNPELIEEIYARGKGLLLLSGHYGNWEILAYSAGLFFNIPVLVIVKPLKNYISDHILNRYRTQAGNQVVPMDNAAKPIVKQLLSKKAVALLADQSATEDKDIFVDFFSMPAATYEAPASLALRLDVPVVMGFAERLDDGSYQVELTEVRHEDLKNDKDGIIEFTRRHVKVLEDAVRKRPDLWSWQHRRWKHHPQKERSNEKVN